MSARIQHTVVPPAPASHNDIYLSAFVSRCRLSGWTEEQIARRIERYVSSTKRK